MLLAACAAVMVGVGFCVASLIGQDCHPVEGDSVQLMPIYTGKVMVMVPTKPEICTPRKK